MPARGRRGRGRARPDARGRCAVAGRPITPSAVSRSSVAVVARPVSRATGTPRSVITTSSPLRARSSQELRCARRSVTVTSMPEVYTTGTVYLYAPLRPAQHHKGVEPVIVRSPALLALVADGIGAGIGVTEMLDLVGVLRDGLSALADSLADQFQCLDQVGARAARSGPADVYLGLGRQADH